MQPENNESSLGGSPDSALIQAEEAKRLRNWNSQQRLHVLLETNTWAEQQLAVQRNTKEECLRRQAILLASMSQNPACPPSADAEPLR